jgi:hypothetical protein
MPAAAVRTPNALNLANGKIGVFFKLASNFRLFICYKPLPVARSGQQLHIFTIFSGVALVRPLY